MPDLTNPMDYYNAYTAGLGGTSVPADWAPQPAQVTVNPDAPDAAPGPGDAYAMAPGTNAVAGGAGAPAAAGLGGIFSGLGSVFGGGGAARAAPGAAPGINQSMVGLGLGLLSGNPFNKWGAAMRGYQTGAAADLARQQQANQYAYQQQQLGIQRGQLGISQQRLALERELAYKPQVQFRLNEDTGEWDALQYDPLKQTVRSLPIAQADKLAEQEGVNATYRSPITGRDEPYPAGVNRREFRKDMAKTQADIASGRITAWQAAQLFYYKWAGGGPAPALQQPPQGIPEGAVRQESNRGNVRWKVKDKEGRTLFYDNQGRLISQK